MIILGVLLAFAGVHLLTSEEAPNAGSLRSWVIFLVGLILGVSGVGLILN
jgi:hypothetical protein